MAFQTGRYASVHAGEPILGAPRRSRCSPGPESGEGILLKSNFPSGVSQTCKLEPALCHLLRHFDVLREGIIKVDRKKKKIKITLNVEKFNVTSQQAF